MNLNIRVDGNFINIWQTPTQISYTILPDGYAKGVKAKEAIIRYCKWVEGSTNGKWSSREELREHVEMCKEHLATMQSLLESGKKFEVHVQ